MQGGNQRLILSIMSQLHRSLPTFFVSFSQSYHKIKKKERENCKKFCCKIINNFSIIIHFSCPALYLLSSGRSPAPVPSGPAAPLPPDLLPQNRPPADRNRCSVVKKHFSYSTFKRARSCFAGAALLLFILSNFLFCVAGSSFIFSPILLAGSPPEPGPRPPGPAT